MLSQQRKHFRFVNQSRGTFIIYRLQKRTKSFILFYNVAPQMLNLYTLALTLTGFITTADIYFTPKINIFRRTPPLGSLLPTATRTQRPVAFAVRPRHHLYLIPTENVIQLAVVLPPGTGSISNVPNVFCNRPQLPAQIQTIMLPRLLMVRPRQKPYGQRFEVMWIK